MSCMNKWYRYAAHMDHTPMIDSFIGASEKTKFIRPICQRQQLGEPVTPTWKRSQPGLLY